MISKQLRKLSLTHTPIRKAKKTAQTCDEVWAVVLFAQTHIFRTKIITWIHENVYRSVTELVRPMIVPLPRTDPFQIQLRVRYLQRLSLASLLREDP